MRTPAARVLLALFAGALLGGVACGSRQAPLAAPPPPPEIPSPRDEVLAYEDVAPKREPSLPRSVRLPAPEQVPLGEVIHPRHLQEGDRAGPDARAAAELWDLAQAAPQPGGPLEGALVACRAVGLDPKHRFDWFGNPEILVELRLGTTPRAIRSSKTATRIFTIPGVRLKKGESLHLEIWDRDLTDRELMVRREPVFDGALPLKVHAPHGRLECAVVPAAEVERRAQAAASQVDTALGWLEGRDRTEGPDVDFGLPREALGEVHRPLWSLAAYRGWDHPEVRPRTRRLEHWLTRWDLAASAHVVELLRRLPATGEWVAPDPAFALRVERWRCEVPDRGRCPSGIDCDRDCTITLEVENRGEAAWVPDGSYDGLGKLGLPWVALEDGRTRSASLRPLPRPLPEPEAGAAAEAAAAPAAAPAPGERPAKKPGPPTTTRLSPGEKGEVEVRFSLQRGRRPMPRLLWFTTSDLLLALVPLPQP
ncbi:MAG: hypothetical protein P1V51_00195 [Deltaproteobacteria bacterium]|nr:hypothetical protein [Deltaproteobacteria bacterium]